MFSKTISEDWITQKQQNPTVLTYGYKKLERKVEKEGFAIAEKRISTHCHYI